MNAPLSLTVVFRSDLKHCYTITQFMREHDPDAFDWVVLEYGFGRIQIRSYGHETHPTIYDLVEPGAPWILVESFSDLGSKMPYPLSCVSLVKAQLGIDKPLIQCPRKLYDYLIKNYKEDV